jgi:hypothetical protein
MAAVMATNKWVTVAANIALIMTVVGAAWLTLGELGVGETVDVIQGDTGNISATTNATFGGSVGFSDQIVTTGAVITILVGFGALAVSSSNPKVMNDLIRYMPLLVGIIGLVSFSDIVQEWLNGTYDFDLYSSSQNALNMFVVGSVIGGAAKLLNMRK